MDENPYQSPRASVSPGERPSGFLRLPTVVEWLAILAFVAFAFVLTFRFTLLMVTPLGVLFVTLGVSIWLALYWSAERRRRRHFMQRPVVAFEDWYAKYYPARDDPSAEAVRSVLEAIARAIGVKPTQLHPSDQLEADLGLPEPYLLDDTGESMEAELEDVAASRGVTFRPDTSWKSLDDVIRGMIG